MNTEKDQFEKINDNDIKKIKEILIKKRMEIIKEINKLTDNDNNVKFPEFGDKSDENAQEINEYTTNLATDKVLESSLKDINSALDRIKNKTYGICKYCQKPINPKRLMARPVASTCIECKTKLQNQ